VHAGVRISRVRVERGAHHPAELAMRIHPLADKLDARSTVALQGVPREVKLIGGAQRLIPALMRYCCSEVS
jgi:hypothetical protein